MNENADIRIDYRRAGTSNRFVSSLRLAVDVSIQKNNS
jgi:hypothetical protein